MLPSTRRRFPWRMASVPARRSKPVVVLQGRFSSRDATSGAEATRISPPPPSFRREEKADRKKNRRARRAPRSVVCTRRIGDLLFCLAESPPLLLDLGVSLSTILEIRVSMSPCPGEARTEDRKEPEELSEKSVPEERRTAPKIGTMPAPSTECFDRDAGGRGRPQI
jgi:hypothetical protein